jgi:hypothetical protein
MMPEDLTALDRNGARSSPLELLLLIRPIKASFVSLSSALSEVAIGIGSRTLEGVH